MTIISRAEASPARAAEPPTAPPHGRRARNRSGQWAAWGFLTPIIVYLLVFYAYPLYRNIDLSLRNYTVRSFINGDAEFTGFKNYTLAFHNPTFWPALLHTFLFTVVSLIFQFTIGLALAVFFIRRFPLSTTLRALFLIPWLLPLIVSASTWSWMFNSDSGVVNSALSWFGVDAVNWLTSPQWALISVIVANIWIGIPFNLVVLYSGLQNIPVDVYEAGSLDGATAWKAFRHITFPLLRPVSAITLLLGFVYTLKVFDIIWVMTKGGPGDASTTLATWSYRLGFGTLVPKFGPGAAVGNLLIIIAVIFGFLYLRVQRSQDDS